MVQTSRTLAEIVENPEVGEEMSVLFRTDVPQQVISERFERAGIGEPSHLTFSYYSVTIDEDVLAELMEIEGIDEIEIEGELEDLKGNFDSRSVITR